MMFTVVMTFGIFMAIVLGTRLVITLIQNHNKKKAAALAAKPVDGGHLG